MELNNLIKSVEQVTSEYCEKFNIKRDNNWFLLKIQEELGELVQSYLSMEKRTRLKNVPFEEFKSNFENELVDLLCLVLSMSKYNDIKVEKVINDKWLKWIEH